MKTEEKIYKYANVLWVLNVIGGIIAVLFIPARKVEHSYGYGDYYFNYTSTEYSWETFFIVLLIAIIELLIVYLIKSLIGGFCELLETQKEISENTKNLLSSVKHKASDNASEEPESKEQERKITHLIFKNDDKEYEGLNDSSYRP